MIFCLKSAILLAILISLAAALEDVKVPDTVYTNRNFSVEVDNDLVRGPLSSDAQFDSYRTFLVMNVTGNYEEQCYLISSTPINSTVVTVQIPPDMGDTGDFYRIGAQPFNQNPNNKPGSPSRGALLQSSSFHLEATNDGPATPDTVFVDYANFTPCTSYNCVRKCVQFYYVSNSSNPGDPCNLSTSYECASKCPDCSFPSWEALYPGSTCTSSQSAPTSPSSTQSTARASQQSTVTLIYTATIPPITSTSTFSRSAATSTSSLNTNPVQGSAVSSVSVAERMTSPETLIMVGMGIVFCFIGNYCY